MSKFTKGPWEVYGNEVVFDHRYQECCGQGGHNGCCGEPIAAGEAGSICECNDPETANFIAAAPDLYEALEDLYNAIDSSVELTPELLKRCSAALAKANGASHE